MFSWRGPCISTRAHLEMVKLWQASRKHGDFVIAHVQAAQFRQVLRINSVRDGGDLVASELQRAQDAQLLQRHAQATQTRLSYLLAHHVHAD